MTTRGRILVVDDEVAARTALAEILRDEGYAVDTAGDGFKALARIDEVLPDLILTDLRMPSMDGFELIRRLRRAEREVPVIVMTAFGAVDSAILAVREGALDFIVKPLDTRQLLLVCDRALSQTKSIKQEAPNSQHLGLPGMVCFSPEMREVARLARIAAPSRAAVLLVGEPGSGRERLARAIHTLSRRANGPFVRADMNEIAQSASEEQSFAEAMNALLQSARGGTLYLRDIHALPRLGALALMDALQANSDADAPRLISSTDRDLRYLAAFGEFESTLLYRVAVVKIELPPLRERRQDLMQLARELLLERTGSDRELGADAVQLVQTYNWPGNVSEFGRTLAAARERANGSPISARDIEFMPPDDKQSAPPPIPGARLAEIERYAILKTLEAHGQSTSRAARVLGISVRKIQYKLHEYGAARGRIDEADADAEQS